MSTVSGLSDHHFRWFVARLMIELYDVNVEARMSVVVKGLAETVRRARDAISKAGESATRLEASAQRVTTTLDQVEGMTAELDAAHAELQAAVGQISNGGPPLDSGATASPAAGVHSALKQVEGANQ